MTGVPELSLPGKEPPISLEFTRPAEMRDVLRLMMDIRGTEIVAPAGPLGSFSMLATELPSDDILNAALASASLVSLKARTSRPA